MGTDFGIKVLSENNRLLIDRNGILQTWVDSVADNLDSSYPMYLRFYLPEETITVQEFKLSFKTENFRSYTTGVSTAGIYVFSEDTTHQHNLDSLQQSSTNIGYDTWNEVTSDEHTDGHAWDTILISMNGFDNHRHPLQGELGSGGSHNHGTKSHNHNLNFGINISSSSPGSISLAIMKDGGSWSSISYSSSDDIDLLSYLDQDNLGGWYSIRFSTNTISRVTASYMMQAMVGVDLIEEA